jgi:hypothetical protein
MGVPTSQAEVTRAQETVIAAEAARAVAELAAETSTQEATATWESVTTLVRDTEDRAALAEREAWERVLWVEVESAAALASAREVAEGLVWRIALLEGELTEVHRTWEVAEENSWGLSNTAADVEQRR